MKFGIKRLAIIAVSTLLLCLVFGTALAAAESMDASDDAALSVQTATQADDLVLYDIDGSAAKTLNGTYTGKKRVIIGGRGTCPRTTAAVSEALRLSKLNEYKDVVFIVLDCDGNKDAFSKAFKNMETERVRFFSSNDGSSGIYSQWLGKYATGHFVLPYFFTIDSNNNLTSWINEITLGWDEGKSKAVEPVLYDAYGIRTSSYSPLVLAAEYYADLGDYAHFSNDEIPLNGNPQLYHVGFGIGTKVTYSSSDPQILAVTSDGTLTPKQKGKAAITAAGGGFRHALNLTVGEDVSDPAISDDPSSSSSSNESGKNGGSQGSSSSGNGSNAGGGSSKNGASNATQAMHRLYNPNSGEHFYTAAQDEHDNLVSLGWNDEGTGWIAPAKSNTPVYRLYNPYGGEHHYTMDAAERDSLVNAGWNDEGVGWYSDDAKTTVLYREYNPNAFSNNHNYTTDWNEHSYLTSIGWNDEGTAWYGVAAS